MKTVSSCTMKKASYKTMVCESILAMGNHIKGSSRKVILNYIRENYDDIPENANLMVNKQLRKGVDQGWLVNVTGGSWKIQIDYKKEMRAEKETMAQRPSKRKSSQKSKAGASKKRTRGRAQNPKG